jgi:GntR family transcriptional regulator/MocR family aminotransferase
MNMVVVTSRGRIQLTLTLYTTRAAMRRAKTVPNDQAKLSAGLSDLVRAKVDRHSRTPFYRQIYERISQAIRDGSLRPGERLPSSRSLAGHLATSRGTIDLAYGLLSSDGYVTARGAGGTVVAFEAGAAAKDRSKPALPRKLRWDETAEVIPVMPFIMGFPAFDAFPRKLWSRLTIRRARSLPLHQLNAPPAGYPPLREAIRSYLAVSRGVTCSVDELFITSGFQGAIGILTRALFEPGDPVWIEDPGYFMARLAFQEAGAKIVPVPVDEHGLNVEAGIEKSPHARFVFVTPSHQMPLGVSLSPARRLALLSWAAKAGAWVIEDDYDSEFRYGSRPLPALKSLDDADRVLYVGTFSKVLFPGLRLGYLVVPESAVARVNRICQLLYRDRPIFEQAVLADFITEGHFGRHIKRMRELYADRRTALVTALTRVFDGQIKIELQAGGMHLLARFPEGPSDVQLAERAIAHGLGPSPLSMMQIEQDRGQGQGQGLMLNFANIPEDQALEMAQRLKKAIAAR